jgi:hypothetical protein
MRTSRRRCASCTTPHAARTPSWSPKRFASRAQAARTSWDVSARRRTFQGRPRTFWDVPPDGPLWMHGRLCPSPVEPDNSGRGSRAVAAHAGRLRRLPRATDWRAGAVSAETTGTLWDEALRCVQCVAADGVAMRSEVHHDVGARQRPNLGANQHGRASLSRSAGNGGASRRLAVADPIEALLDRSTTGRATNGWTIEPSGGPWNAAAGNRVLASKASRFPLTGRTNQLVQSSLLAASLRSRVRGRQRTIGVSRCPRRQTRRLGPSVRRPCQSPT